LQAASTVYQSIGPFCTEEAYRDAMVSELSGHNISVVSEPTLEVRHGGIAVGNRRPDLWVRTDGKSLIVELKAQSSLRETHHQQAISYAYLSKSKPSLKKGYVVLVNFCDQWSVDTAGVQYTVYPVRDVPRVSGDFEYHTMELFE